MYVTQELIACANSITFCANAHEQIRLGASHHVMDMAHHGDFTPSSESVSMEIMSGYVVNLIEASLKITIARPSEVSARLQILNVAARVLGVDHPLVGKVAAALTQDVERISNNTF